MNLKKILPILCIVLCLFICISQVTADDSTNSQASNSQYIEGESGEFIIDLTYPTPIDEYVDLIKNFPELYDNNETINWMEGLGDYVVVYCGNDYAIMEKSEAKVIYDFDKQSALVDEKTPFKCDVLEIHNISSDGLEIAYLVENVQLTGENIKYSQSVENPDTGEEDYTTEDIEFKVRDSNPHPVSDEIEELDSYYDRHYGDMNDDGNIISDTASWIFGDGEEEFDYDEYKEEEEVLDTKIWLNDFEDYVAISTDDGNYLIMSKTEAKNLPEPDDEVEYNIIKCDVEQTKTARYTDYILVKNVELINQEKIENETEQEVEEPTTSDTSASSTSYSDSGSSGSYGSYIGNSNTGKFHHASCGDVNKMSDKNKVYLSSREEAISRGFSPCGHCHP